MNGNFGMEQKCYTWNRKNNSNIEKKEEEKPRNARIFMENLYMKYAVAVKCFEKHLFPHSHLTCDSI